MFEVAKTHGPRTSGVCLLEDKGSRTKILRHNGRSVGNFTIHVLKMFHFNDGIHRGHSRIIGYMIHDAWDHMTR